MGEACVCVCVCVCVRIRAFPSPLASYHQNSILIPYRLICLLLGKKPCMKFHQRKAVFGMYRDFPLFLSSLSAKETHWKEKQQELKSTKYRKHMPCVAHQVHVI
jgi:hypothetical protein